MPAIELLVDAVPGEVRVAVLDGGVLTDLLIDRPSQPSLVGGIYRGRVARVVPAINAAFIDIGYERPAILNVADVRSSMGTNTGDVQGTRDRIGDFVGEGDGLVVQVVADATPGKGPRVTARPRIAGRFVMLDPNAADGEDGFSLRNAANGALPADLAFDRESVRERAAQLRTVTGKVSQLLPPDDAVRVALLRHIAGVPVRILAEGPLALHAVRAAIADIAPAWADRIESRPQGAAIFNEAGVSDALAEAFGPVLPLAGGGDVRLAATPALLSIDVNSGSPDSGEREQAILAINRQASNAIARLIRLRNEAGAIVIDFVPQRRRANGRAVLGALRGATENDPSTVRVAGFGPLGFVELTRARYRAPLAEWLWYGGVAGQTNVLSPVSQAFEIVRRLARGVGPEAGGAVQVRACTATIAALDRGEAADARAWAEERAGAKVRLVTDETRSGGRFDVLADRGPDRNG